MATLTRSTTVSGGTLYHRITYSVTNTDTTTTVTLTKVEARFSNSSSYFPFAAHSLTVACDGTTLYTHAKDDVTVYTTGTTWKTVATPNKSKSFTRGKTAATKSISLTYMSTSSADITVPAKPSYAVTYNGNGATSGTPSAQTKWYGETLPLSTAKPTRTNYVFKNWNTAAAGTGTAYASGASYTANAALTLYAQWYAPYTITPNANGGTLKSGCTALTKVYNTPLNLWADSLSPTRTDFAFAGWNTSSSGSGTNYRAGASYIANANATLYAQWQRTYADPKVTINSVQRVDATSHDANDESRSVAVRFSWNLFAIPSQSNHPTSVVVTVDKGDDPDVAITLTNLTGTTGTTTTYLDADCHPDQQYVVTVALTDLGGSTRSVTAKGIVTSQYYPIDIRQGGKGVAIGGPSNEDALDVFMPLKVLKRSTSATETPFQIHDGVVAVADFPWAGGLRLRKNGYINLYDENEESDPGTPPEAAHYGQSLMGYDANGYNNFYSQTGHTTADALYRSFVAKRRVNNSDVTNGLYLYIDANGTRRVTFSDPAAWCAGLDSGRYTEPTALPLASGCAAYDSAGTPRYARDGHVVSVWGTVKPTAEVAAGGTMTIGTLPAGYRPPNDIRVVCHGSYAAMWLLTINTGGTLSAQRYSSNGETYAAMTTGVWMPFSATFITTS